MNRTIGPDVVCVLAEGRYFHGVAALANSLLHHGFAGHVVVGYRGALPDWDGPVRPEPDRALALAPGVDMRFVPLHADWTRGWSLANLKPHFLLRVAADLHPGCRSLWYFDVDIVLKTGWSHFARWSEAGAVLVLDLAETFMPATHLFRREWRALGERAGFGCRPVEGYFNSGCVGVGPDGLALLHAWRHLTELLSDTGVDMGRLVSRSGKPEFAKMDQDLLNAAVMACTVPYGVLGVEAMDAFPSAEIMSHAMVFAKPWSRDYLRDALKGFQPDAPHLAFWRHADGPIRSFGAAERRRKRAALRIARLIGHLKRRTVRDW